MIDSHASKEPQGSNVSLPVRAGVGFKPQHFDDIVAGEHDVAWFEVHAENYMGEGGPPHRMLSEIAGRYPLSIHGVGLSIGGSEPLDPAHLARLQRVIDRYQPAAFSEHLAWSTHDSTYFNDLLPLPLTRQTLDCVGDHVAEVQDRLGRQMLLENPSSYVAFAESTISETDFLGELAHTTGCGLLLDVNNVQVSATNLGFDPVAYLDAFPVEHVGEIHLGGHEPSEDDKGQALLVDTHDRPVAEDVWSLFARVITRAGPVATLIEWDSDVPDWADLADEAAQADAILSGGSTSEQTLARAG